ncbi:lytic transglycosylase domain-containing protein [Roseomonas sp. GC11]|uniref:lytic transglycosylase domain-containing protein n=1 Tax=Roseomonas sp. GC11 TaxID=2950546 RepID=UPI00210D2680|nr:lytic transglycosylase domain-containing protein [Roseomonas sp. GC11]MCQ4162284.1 lytic transglycosylase domain-containing protein [Roseomonas sp. GC11]
MAVVEREFNLPPALLAAIGRVESGRRDDTTGRIEPYPWTINAEGRGSIYPSKAAAIAAVRDLQAGGLRSIDVGCMQINLRHHPEAFPNLETAFDPLANIRYAARFLTELYASRQDWARAAAAYHSQTPEYAEAYLARVQAAWEIERRQAPPTATALAAASAPGLPVTARPGGGFLSNGAERAQIRTAAPGNVGRGLDAYRSAPIPLAGRGARPLVAENVPAPGGVRRLF